MTIIDTRSGTSHEDVPEAHAWVRRTREALREVEADNNQQICIVATDRGIKQRKDILQLLGNENVDIVWARFEDVFRIWRDIQDDKKIDGLLLTARGEQSLHDTSLLDQSLLQNLLVQRDGSRSVPTLAMGDSMTELLQILGGIRCGMYCVTGEESHLVNLEPGSRLHTWAGVDRMQVTGGYDLASIDVPSCCGLIVNALNDEFIPNIEGFETVTLPLQVGTRFDPVELALRAPTEDTAQTARKIIQGFLAEVRAHAAS